MIGSLPVLANAGRNPAPGGPDTGDRTRFAFLAETSRCLADSLDYQATLTTVARMALPHFGSWCMVDIVEDDDAINRVAVIHSDPISQERAREYYSRRPPQRTDPLGAARVIRTQHSEFHPMAVDSVEGLADEEQQLLATLGAGAFLIVPLSARNRTFGAITFVSDGLRQYDDADLLLAEDLGRRCAMAIDNARLYRLAESARRAAEAAREDAAFAAQRSDTQRLAADAARAEAVAADRSKAKLLMTLAHEFRTPLGGILGYVGLLNEEIAGPLTLAQREYLVRIGKSGRHLLDLIEEVLTISQMHTGRAKIRLENVDLSLVCREAVELMMPLARSKRLVLRLDLPGKSVIAPADQAKFRQIVINLLGNAIKFTSKGEVTLQLLAEEQAVVLHVRDTGPGISATDMEQLFESFWQSSAAEAATHGTGLGLAISRQLARLMGGDVSISSVPGKGSTFTVDLPIRRRESDGRPAEQELAPEGEEWRSRSRRQ